MDNIKQAYNYVKECLIHPKTNLIYDHNAHHNPLQWPTAEECAANIPDPSGYGTGMEDCMISGGTMLDGCILMYEKTHDAQIGEFAKRVAKGMIANAEAAKSSGFIPRGVSPADGKSHYIDTSVDQYTLFIYGMHLYVNSSLCSYEDKKRISVIAQNVAYRAEKNVIAENDYNLLCEDGTKSLWAQFWGETLQNHAYMRLAMIYLFAWEMSQNTHFLDLYHEILDTAIEKSLPMESYWHLYAIHQMQVSVKLCYDIEPDYRYKEKLINIMREVAKYMETMVDTLRLSLKDKSAYNVSQKPFRECKCIESASYKERLGLSFNSVLRPDGNDYWTLQDIAIVSIVLYLVPEAKLNKKASDLLHTGFKKIDFKKHERSLPVHFFTALCREYFLD